MATPNSPVPIPEPTHSDSTAGKIAESILGFLANIPETHEQPSYMPAAASRTLANKAAAQAALAAGTLALPPGPLGWLTILPELVAVWKIQAQMVADIAAIYGKKTTLTREQMLYCLFRHMAAQAVRDLVVRVGERWLVRSVSLPVFQALAQRIGVRVSQRAVGKGISRWLPIIGALGVAAYAYYDTGQVAKTAIELFEKEIDLEAGPVLEIEAVRVG